MREKMLQVAEDIATRRLPIDEAGRREAQEFLRWTAEDHFTLFGYREYEVKKKGKEEILCAVEGSGLGLLRAKEVGKPRLLKSLAAHYMPQSGAVDALILTKTNARSTVHRPGRSEEHTSELQSLMRISYAVFCLKKKNVKLTEQTTNNKQ